MSEPVSSEDVAENGVKSNETTTSTKSSEIILPDNIEINQNVIVVIEADEDASPNDTKNEQSSSKTSRELKSLLALSKEANMDLNISHKRKSVDLGLLAKKRTLSISDSSSNNEENKHMKDKDDHNKTSKRKKDGLLNDIDVGGAGDEAVKRKRRTSKADISMNKVNKDSFCWRCHRDGVGVSCETCPRSFHLKCLRQSVTNLEHWPCPECVTILKAESTKTRSPAMKGMSLEHLCNLLKFAHKRMMQCTGSEPFMHPVNEKEFPDYKNYIVQPMDLTRLEKNIKENLYGSTQAFEADAKWILHNSIIFNSFSIIDQSKLTTIAKSIMKVCKQEMSEIENCPSCYLNANTKKNSWFVEVCPKPHILLWAKLKGFPYWPAKAMSTNSSGMVDVRFFGAHDRAWVPYKECFLYSRKDPNSNKQKRNDINECIKELEIHIDNLKKVYGEFNYAPYRTPIEPENEIKQLLLFLPNYKPSATVSYDKKVSEIVEETESTESQNIDKESKNEKNKEYLKKSEEKYESSNEADKEMESDNESDKPNKMTKSNDGGIISDDEDFMQYSEDKEDDFETQIEASVIEDNRNCGKVKVRGGFTTSSTGKIKIIPRQISENNLVRKRLSTEEFLEVPQKLSRRNSDQSIKSDSSRLSSVSDKISHIDISENIEITLGNDDIGNISISGNVSSSDLSDSSKSEMYDLETKRKHIVQVNIENKEFTISPQNKLRIADKLIKKFAETEETTTSDISSNTEKVKRNLVNSNKECDSTKTQTDVLLEKKVQDELDKDKQTSTDDKQDTQSNSNGSEISSSGSETLKSDKDKTNNDDKASDESRDMLDDTQIDEVNIRNIIHSSLNEIELIPKPKKSTVLSKSDSKNNENGESPKKRKLSDVDDQIFQDKLQKLVENADMLKEKSNDDTITSKDTDTSIFEELSSSIDIKSEPLSDEECTSETTEAKKIYLSALNISEKQPEEDKNKQTENRAKSFKIVDNLTRVIDTVASNYSQQHEGEEITLKKTERLREIQIKAIAKNQISKPKARKSFPTPTRQTKKDVVSKTNTNKPENPASMLKTYLSPALTKISDQAPTITSNIRILPQPITVLPPNQPFTYTANTGPSILIQQPLLTTRNDNAEESQNFIPQNSSARTSETTSTIVTTNTNQIINTLPSLAPLSSNTPICSVENLTQELNELNVLKSILPEGVSKVMSDLLSRPPPKLKPRPPSMLSTQFDEGLPSSAGTVTTRINSVSHRLGDYLRGMLIETLSDLGTSENPEALITTLKLENEALRHKHSHEMLEIKKNICSILKDIQKSVLEEREKIIEETRTACEAEAIKRVEEAKSKQWCANCFKEAQFYCCWNTSYCDYPCQQKHWPKHMSKCIQTTSKSTTPTTNGQKSQIVLRTNAPKTLSGQKTIIAKPAKVIVNRNTNVKGPITQIMKTTAGSHLTLVESTPGNYELVGNGPIAVGGKFIASTSIMGKLKTGNLITVTSPSSTSVTTTSGITNAGAKVTDNNSVQQSPLGSKTTSASDFSE